MRSSGTPAARAASYEHSSNAARLVDVDVGAHALRVREAHHAVVGRDRADLLGGVAPCATTRSDSSAATAANRAHSSLTCRWCSSTVRRPRARSAVSNSGYTSVRRERESARHLVLAGAGPVVADHPLARRVVAGLPVELALAARGRARQRVCIDSAPPIERDVELVALDALAPAR